jgi:uncharacterized damage-inducible protein DinB
MPGPSLTATELIHWNEVTAHHWKAFVTQHPAVLDLPCDVREGATARDLLQHIVAVELRYAERLHATSETPYEVIPKDSPEHLFAIHDHAMQMLNQLLDDPAYPWDAQLSFTARSGGTMHAPRKIILIHALMHSIRHYAQLATIARQHGHPTTWPGDYLYMAHQPA